MTVRMFGFTLVLLMFVAPLTAQINNPDPCPTAQDRFAGSRQEAMAAAAQVRTAIESAKFPKDNVEQQIVQKIEAAMREDILGTIDAYNETAVAQGKVPAGTSAIAASDAFLATMASKKASKLIASSNGKKRVQELLTDAEKAFESERASKLKEYEQWRNQLDAKWEEEKQKLDGSCDYAAWAVALRVVLELFKIDTRIEDGMLKIGDFKTDIPQIFGGTIMLGDHPLLNIPEIKGNNIEIGGTVIAQIPHVTVDDTGRQMFSWGDLKTDVIPRIDVKVPPVSVGTGGDHGGLGVSVGIGGTTIKF